MTNAQDGGRLVQGLDFLRGEGRAAEAEDPLEGFFFFFFFWGGGGGPRCGAPLEYVPCSRCPHRPRCSHCPHIASTPKPSSQALSPCPRRPHCSRCPAVTVSSPCASTGSRRPCRPRRPRHPYCCPSSSSFSLPSPSSFSPLSSPSSLPLSSSHSSSALLSQCSGRTAHDLMELPDTRWYGKMGNQGGYQDPHGLQSGGIRRSVRPPR